MKKLFGALGLVAYLSVSVSADASYIYRYEGNNFDEFSTPSPYDTTMALTAEFTLSNPIPPESAIVRGENFPIGTPFGNSEVVSFWIHDGLNVLTDTNSAEWLLAFYITRNGWVSSWYFLASGGDGVLDEVGDARYFMSSSAVEVGQSVWDLAGVTTCIAINADGSCQTDGGSAQLFDSDNVGLAGTWSVRFGVPAPTPLALFGLGLIALGWQYRMRNTA